MGQTKSIVTVPSPNPDADRELLQELLPFRRQPIPATEERESSSTAATLLLWEDDCLVLTTSPATCSITWVLSRLSYEQIQKASQKLVPTRTRVLTGLSGQGFQLTLPSGSSLLVLTEASLTAEQDRIVIAHCLEGVVHKKEESNGITGSSPSKQFRKMESTGSLSELSLDDSRSSSPLKMKRKPEAPKINALSTKIMQEQGAWDSNFALNSSEPYPFETELFQGEVLLLVRPPKLDEDPYWSDRIFSKKKRRLVLNIQGKFKRPVQGSLYVGGEITSPMNLSLFTRGLLGMLIKLLESGFSGLQYSFGDEKKKLSPRISVPAFSGMERVVVTPPDETPPPMTGDPFEESKQDRTKRLKSKDWQWNTTDTYSFSFFSMYVDLCTWKIVNVPISSDINLRRLWNDGDFRLVMYEKTGKGKDHYSSCLSYGWNINLRYLGDKRVPRDDGDENSSDETDEFEDIALDSDRRKRLKNSSGDESDSSFQGFYRSEGSSLFPAILEGDSSSEDEEDYYDANSEVIDHNLSDDYTSTPSEAVALLASIDELVPAWIQVASEKGKYERVFAICRGQSTLLLSASDCKDHLNKSQASESIHARIEQHFSPRLSSHESTRRSIGLFLKENGETAFDSLQKTSVSYQDQFLRRRVKHLEKTVSGTILRGFAARAISDRQWEEEWLVLSEEGVLSCYHPEKRKIRLRIQMSNILKTYALPSELAPAMQGFGFLCIETFGRTLYFLYESPKSRDLWLKALWDLQKNIATDEQSVDSEVSRRVLSIGQPSEEFVHKSSMWHCKNRRILNCGRYNLKCRNDMENPLEMVKEALQLSIDSNFDESGERRHLFFMSAGALKRAMVQTLPEEGRLAFFLNLYHCMVMHAFLVIGPPGSGLKWISFFNNLAYEVGDDLFSISELEHCIIRSRMSHPSQFMSRFVIPKSHYRMELNRADFRINFALNPGSISSPSSVLMYDPETINEQLDMASNLYLDKASVVIKGSNDVVVNLPRICQWFLDDFGSQEDLLQKIDHLLKSEDRLSLEKARLTGLNVTVRFDDYSFKCKPFTLQRSLRRQRTT
eukprot:scaffold8332_cov172-Amphora_coffeaeformis.AAC.2